MDQLLNQFKSPPRAYSAVAFWFLSGELEPERLKWQIGEMVDKGVYGGFMHPRPFLITPYLEDAWWQAVDACVEEARIAGFYPWLYDEYAWPSGTAGSVFPYGYQKPSRVLAQGECNMAKGLYVKSYTPRNGRELQQLVEEEGTEPVALFVLKDAGEGSTRAVRLHAWDDLSEPLAVMAFHRQVYQTSVDYLNKDTIAAFIACTHEEYRKRYGKDFGSLIPGIFFDEIYMMGHPFPWTDSLPREFSARCGYDLLDELPSLMEGESERDRKVRADYYRVIAELYEEAFFVQISSWCERNHLKLTGHTEETLREHPVRQGNYFNTIRHLQIPGADNHDYRYRFPRKITYCEPKYSVSVARIYDRDRCLSEAMGGAGWGCSLQQFKRGINTMGAMGISLFCLHGFYYECERQGSQADWPTSFFYQNPYWKYFKIFGDYMSRVSYMNSAGRPVVEVGLLYPIEDIQLNTIAGAINKAARDMDAGFHEVLRNLLERQIDTDMIDAHSIVCADVSAGGIEIGRQRFRVLICPNTLTVSRELAEKLREFMDAGGDVVFYRCGAAKGLPEGFYNCVLCGAGEMAAAMDRLFTPDIYVSQGSRYDLFANHRIIEGKDCYFISNSADRPRSLTLRLRSAGNVSKMDPETGAVVWVDSRVIDSGTEVKLTLEADEGCYLIFGSTAGRPGVRWRNAGQLSLSSRWEFLPLDASFDDRYSTDASRTALSIPVAAFASDLSGGSRLIRICNTAQEEGCCGRHLTPWQGGWITRRPSWHCDSRQSDLYLRRKWNLPRRPDAARFCIAAVNTFTLYINGRQVCRQDSNAQPVVVDAAAFLRQGDNLVAVRVHNDTPLPQNNLSSVAELPPECMISLLLQGEADMDGGKAILASDESWIVTNREQAGWLDPAVELEQSAVRIDPSKLRGFFAGAPDGQWLYAWERGKPPLHPWGDIPLMGAGVPYPVSLCYGVTLPAGTVSLGRPKVRGEYESFLDGMPIGWHSDHIPVKSDGRTHHLEIRMTAMGPDDGLLRPVEVTVEPFVAPLCDWRLHGLSWFSGRGMYRCAMELTKDEGRLLLDMGQVNFAAEIWVNGKLAGVRIWNPYRVDITEFVRDGVNELVVITANSAAAERRNMLVDEGMALGWDRYWNEDNIDREGENLVSGLLGPVRIYRQTIEA